MNDNKQLRILSCGEVLWDIIHDQEHIGGAPFNLAAHLAQLGCDARMLTRIGDDPRGKAALAEMGRLGVYCSLVKIDPDHPTGYARVNLSGDGVASYTFPPNPAYNFIEADDGLIRSLAAADFDAICFGTLQQKGDRTRASLMRVPRDVPARQVFFDINIRMKFYPAEVLRESLSLSTIVKLNEDEVPRVAQRLYDQAMPEPELAARLSRDFPIRIVCITKGPAGCIVFRGNESQTIPIESPVKVADTVGAGDAFSAALLQHYCKTGDPFASARHGNLLGAYVASKTGAVPAYDSAILKNLQQALFGQPVCPYALFRFQNEG